VRSFPLDQARYCRVSLPDASHVLVCACRKQDGAVKDKMWALDAATGEMRLLHTAPVLGIAAQGATSSERGEVLFLAGTDKQLEPFALRLADLSVRKLDVELDLSHLLSVRWRADGKILLVESQRPRKDREELALWALTPGEPKPTCFYRQAAGYVSAAFSPMGRWALVGSGREFQKIDRCEIVDLLSGKARPLDWPLPMPYEAAWSPDGEAFAYAAREPDRQTVIVVRASTASATRVYTAADGRIGFLSLSREGRYVACSTRSLLGTRLRVIDTATGRVVRLHGAAPLWALAWTAWSPAQFVLAATGTDAPFHPDQPTRIRLYEFPSP